MSTIVADLRAGIGTRVASFLPGTPQVMRRVFQPENNDTRNMKNSYAVIPGTISDVSDAGTFKNYTVDQVFEVLLGDSMPDRGDDEDKQVAIDALYDVADDILADILGAGLSNIVVADGLVLATQSPSIGEAEIFSIRRSERVALSIARPDLH